MINRRSFFSKFSLLAFFAPFMPKLKSFLYDKNLEDKSIKNFDKLVNTDFNLKLPYLYFDKYNLKRWICCYRDENNNYCEEIFNSKKHKFFEYFADYV